jgi:hypothetical protein
MCGLASAAPGIGQEITEREDRGPQFCPAAGYYLASIKQTD